ncbi:MAG: DLW-39 family protein [Actinomycetes bacterium]|nr:DLW-39 family protein [Actinomycetes bacterium]MDX5380214.1 DLW-39 family protein [Actinomycetes bacterium]MDX5398901.1 DLW-39 family protein [Actinomycetes bacterium]MDX5449944.1 DLW-39 family protein [Actinomycetes bacterium]
MKRLLWTAAGAVVGWLVWTRVQEEREERSIWAEVTDSFGETPDGNVPIQS